ncbi:tyrosine-type recombinase/integrase [Cytobacillus sp. Hz8]|uniref:tyrosine-type recombinase/integrase n=1 Tax=Cytobacillus sp. Hz8 TaxID=3347168 RepID=UPI0035D644DA
MIFQVKNNYEVFVKKFLMYLSRNGYSEETIVGYSKDLAKFNQHLIDTYGSQVTVLDITKEDILDYQDALTRNGYAKNSIARHISTIKSFSKYLFNEVGCGDDPGSKVKTPKVYTPLTTVLTEEQMKQLIETAKNYSPFYHVLISFLYYTGSRISPVITLLKEHVYLNEKKVYFPKIKGGKDLYLPLHDQLVNLLEQHIYSYRKESRYVFPSPKFLDKPISAADVRFHLKKIQKAAGIQVKITPHLIRHCTATHLTLKGADQRYLAAILGHSDLRSTMRYQHLNVDNLRDTLSTLD